MSESSWSRTYPYKVDYNDHFETPVNAYRDILPLLDAIQPLREEHGIYDPFFCDGRTKRLLEGEEFGFANVIHECRDFYKDIAADQVPEHDTLITNPPYSDQHKEKCIEYCLEQLKKKDRPFFVLMPNYVAAREYYRKQVEQTADSGIQEDVIYLLPSTPYEYDHPEGTGHKISPFASIWYCGIGRDRVNAMVQEGSSKIQLTGGAKLMTSLQELRKAEAIPTMKRGNPRQRRKRKQQHDTTFDEIPPALTAATKTMNTKSDSSSSTPIGGAGSKSSKRKKSRHRDPKTGTRTKKRF